MDFSIKMQLTQDGSYKISVSVNDVEKFSSECKDYQSAIGEAVKFMDNLKGDT